MMVETYLLRGKRRLDALSLLPGFAAGSRLLLYGGGGLLLSAGGLWGRMQPLAAGLVCGCEGLWAVAAAVGSGLGYRLFWGRAGLQGVVWAAAGLALALTVRRWAAEARRAELLVGGSALIAAAAGLIFQLRLGDTEPVSIYLLRIPVAAASACLFCRRDAPPSRVTVWLIWAAGVWALAGLTGVPWFDPGCIAAGAIGAAAPLSAAALAGIGLEAAGIPTMSAGLCLGCLLRLAPIRDKWRRMAAPGLGCLCAMVLARNLNPGALLCVSLGGVLGASVPWHWSALQRPSGMGALQVRLEQTAQIFQRMQHGLLDAPCPPVDRQDILRQLRENACSECSCRSSCSDRNRLDETIFSEPFGFSCRKNGRIIRELRRSQGQLRFLEGQRRRMAEYRGALAQQYGYLSGYLQLLSDRLPLRERAGRGHFHVQVSSRSAGKEPANGDRCIAFPGIGFRYYVLLCDGMGTGLGAAEEGRKAAVQIRQMLTAGFPPQYALGSINSHLALRGQAGAVTVDLAELRLDSGRAAIYKWGAAQSVLLRRGRAEKIGTATPPPGISVEEIRETAVRLSLSRGETLILVSDGIEFPDLSQLSALSEGAEPGVLAERILQEYGSSGEDDATAAVICLRPVPLSGSG